MESTKGFFYSTKTAANNAIKTINQGEGLPNNGFTTKTYCEPTKCVGGWFVLVDEITSKYLSGEIDVELLPIEL